MGWVVGWLNILGTLRDYNVLLLANCATGQVAGLSSTEFGLSNMIWAAVVIAKVRSCFVDVSQR